ncbi:unnamed protein product [Vitrella brassicaformis CCMP3155]|uniref:Helicase ATP-binding domain-containing protein n=5 Tax=Vitrella brassicaformis TaxID=1169539 RepID=A0A0G4GUE1_VITBC|nr:unnamed protein product [Vitrella brassicaformis CCMP3155]|eukprot:CEM34455.1 unnamed protein product [Vitrella brassicaformis CCMP3155]
MPDELHPPIEQDHDSLHLHGREASDLHEGEDEGLMEPLVEGDAVDPGDHSSLEEIQHLQAFIVSVFNVALRTRNTKLIHRIVHLFPRSQPDDLTKDQNHRQAGESEAPTVERAEASPPPETEASAPVAAAAVSAPPEQPSFPVSGDLWERLIDRCVWQGVLGTHQARAVARGALRELTDVILPPRQFMSTRAGEHYHTVRGNLAWELLESVRNAVYFAKQDAAFGQRLEKGVEMFCEPCVGCDDMVVLSNALLRRDCKEWPSHPKRDNDTLRVWDLLWIGLPRGGAVSPSAANDAAYEYHLGVVRQFINSDQLAETGIINGSDEPSTYEGGSSVAKPSKRPTFRRLRSFGLSFEMAWSRLESNEVVMLVQLVDRLTNQHEMERIPREYLKYASGEGREAAAEWLRVGRYVASGERKEWIDKEGHEFIRVAPLHVSMIPYLRSLRALRSLTLQARLGRILHAHYPSARAKKSRSEKLADRAAALRHGHKHAHAHAAEVDESAPAASVSLLGRPWCQFPHRDSYSFTTEMRGLLVGRGPPGVVRQHLGGGLKGVDAMDWEDTDTWGITITSLVGGQRDALEKSLRQRLTIIQGPPGTGKTHTAAAIVLAWTIIDPHTNVLAVADSNAAAANLVATMRRLGVRCIRVGIDADETPTDAQAVKDAIRQHQVVVSTCVGAGGTSFQGAEFERVLVDECTQSTEPATLVALARKCRQLVLIGDANQLPPTVISREATQRGLSVSLFERLSASLSPSDDCFVMLDHQRRMHSSLSWWPNQHFYKEQLKNALPDSSLPPIVGFPWPSPTTKTADTNDVLRACFIDVSSAPQSTATDIEHVAEQMSEEAALPIVNAASDAEADGGGSDETSSDQPPASEGLEGCSFWNDREAKVVAAIVGRLLKGQHVTPAQIGVITPYRAQRQLLSREIGSVLGGLETAASGGLAIDTVDGFQGNERDLILVSLVRCNSDGRVGFLADPRRMNVAITRARRGIIVVGHRDTLSKRDTMWRRWVEWVAGSGGAVHWENIRSSFVP